MLGLSTSSSLTLICAGIVAISDVVRVAVHICAGEVYCAISHFLRMQTRCMFLLRCTHSRAIGRQLHLVAGYHVSSPDKNGMLDLVASSRDRSIGPRPMRPLDVDDGPQIVRSGLSSAVCPSFVLSQSSKSSIVAKYVLFLKRSSVSRFVAFLQGLSRFRSVSCFSTSLRSSVIGVVAHLTRLLHLFLPVRHSSNIL
jgi:hypothetical protein